MPRRKIVLIHVGNFCESKTGEGQAPPLGIIYLGSYLDKRGFQAALLDSRLKDRDAFYPGLEKELPETMLVGLSVATPLVGEGLEITNFIKKLDPAIPIVWGGFHATLFSEATINHKNIDFVITGEGEKGLLGLAEYLSGEKDILGIPGLVYKHDGAVMKNDSAFVEDLDLIGIPAYKMLDFSLYLERSCFTQRKKVDILTSRGCLARCAFCVNSIIDKNHWRSESIGQTLTNIDTVAELYKAEHVCFTDEDFFCSLKRVKQLLPELSKRKITWDANCRASHLREGYLDDNLLYEMYESGCRGLRFGLESGSQRILDMFKKGLTPEQSLHAVRQALKHGIVPNVSFMMGVPDENLDDVLKTLNLILEIYRLNPKIQIIGPQMFRPYPGSLLFNRCVEKGLIAPENLDNWRNFFIGHTIAFSKRDFPWISRPDDLRKVDLCRACLIKQYLPSWLCYLIVKFHVITRLKLIGIDYYVFKLAKSIFKQLRGR